MNNVTPSPEPPGRKRRPFDIANFILGRGAAIVVCGLAMAMLLAPFAFLKREPYYHAGGSLLVSPKVSQFLSRQDRTIHGSFRDFSETHAKRLLTGEVLVGALESIPPQEWPDYLHGGDSVEAAAEALRPRLEVKPVDNSYLLFVSMTSDQPGGVAEAVNAVMVSYIRKLEAEQEAQSERRLTYLRTERESVLAAIEEKKVRQTEVAVELKSRSFNEFKNPYFESVVTMQEQYLLAKARELEALSEVDLADRNIEEINRLELDVFAEEAVARNEAVYLIDNWTYQKLQELRGKIDGLTPENPDRIYIEERMAAMTDYLETFKDDLHADFDRILTDKRAFELEERATRARTSREAAELLTAQLKTAFEESARTFQRSTELIAEGQELEDDIELLRNRLGLIEESIRNVSLDAKAPTHVSVEERATAPVSPVSDNLVKYLAMICVAALGLAASIGVLLEMLDTRVRGDRDLRHALGVPAPDAIGQLGDSTRKWNELLIARQPGSPVAAAIRRLVVRLCQQAPAEGGSVLVFAGAHAEAGTTALARNACIAVSQYRGSVLHLDIDLQFGGPSSVSAGFEEDEAPAVMALGALQRTRWHGQLGRLRLAADDPVLLNRQALKSLIEQARAKLGAVVIDTGTLVECDVSQFLVQLADAGVLVARDRRTLYSQLRGGIEFLYRSSAPAFTAVLTNAVPSPIERLIAWKESHLGSFGLGDLRGTLRALWRVLPGVRGGSPLPLPRPSPEAV